MFFKTLDVMMGRLKTGESVLIQGASSGVGRMALMIAKHMGAGVVIGTSTNAERRARLKEFGADQFEIVTPSLSILAEPPVSIVDKNAKRHGTTEVAKAYLDYLYSDEGQEIAAKNFYRPRNEAVAAKYADHFTKLKLVSLNEEFGSWANAQKTHFADGGVFDQIYLH